MSGSIHVLGILRQTLVILASVAVAVVLMNSRMPFPSRLIWVGSIIVVIAVAFAVLSVRATSPLRGLGRQAAALLGEPHGARSPSQSHDIAAIQRAFILTEQLKLDYQKYCEEFQEAKRLSTLGQLAAGVAHELNNPPGGILVYANLILEDMVVDDIHRGNLAKIIRETNRCRNIFKSLLDFARQCPPRLTMTDINAIILEALKNVHDDLESRNVRVTEHFEDELPQVLVDGSPDSGGVRKPDPECGRGARG